MVDIRIYGKDLTTSVWSPLCVSCSNNCEIPNTCQSVSIASVLKALPENKIVEDFTMTQFYHIKSVNSGTSLNIEALWAYASIQLRILFMFVFLIKFYKNIRIPLVPVSIILLLYCCCHSTTVCAIAVDVILLLYILSI